HQAATLAHCADRIGKPDRSGRDQRAVFAKTVARRDFRFAADFIAIDAQRRDRRRHDGGLSVGAQPQLILRAFEAELGKRKPKRVVGFLERLARDREVIREFLAHPDPLRSLPRKKKRQLHLMPAPHESLFGRSAECAPASDLSWLCNSPDLCVLSAPGAVPFHGADAAPPSADWTRASFLGES